MEWHENPEFWEAVRDLTFPPRVLDGATDQIEQLLSLLDIEHHEDVLDVPCGIGRHAIELADRGFAVTAVDATESFLSEARESE